MTELIRNLNDHDFSAKVLEGACGWIAVAFLDRFSAGCKIVREQLPAIAAKHARKLTVYEVDADESPSLVDWCKIEATPTIVLFCDSEIAARFEGISELEEKILVAMKKRG